MWDQSSLEGGGRLYSLLGARFSAAAMLFEYAPGINDQSGDRLNGWKSLTQRWHVCTSGTVWYRRRSQRISSRWRSDWIDFPRESGVLTLAARQTVQALAPRTTGGFLWRHRSGKWEDGARVSYLVGISGVERWDWEESMMKGAGRAGVW